MNESSESNQEEVNLQIEILQFFLDEPPAIDGELISLRNWPKVEKFLAKIREKVDKIPHSKKLDPIVNKTFNEGIQLLTLRV